MNISRRPVLVFSALILFIAGSIFAWKYFGAEKNEMKDWQTYRVEHLKLSTKIPSEYQRATDEFGGVYNLYTQDESIAMEEKDGKFLASQVAIFASPLRGPALEKIKQSIKNLKMLEIEAIGEISRQSLKKTRNVDIDGCEGVVGQTSFNGEKETIVMTCLRETDINSGLQVYISTTAKQGLITQYEQTFKQILSTLSFEEEGIKNWPSYTNNEFGIFFRYPLAYDTEQKFEQCKPHTVDEGEPILFVGPLSVYMEDPQGLSLENYVDKEAEELMTAQEAPEVFESELFAKRKIRLSTKDAWIVTGRISAASIYEPHDTYVAHKGGVLHFNADNGVLSSCLWKRGQKPNDAAQQILSTIFFK